MIESQISGHSVIVTGAAGGIGQALVEQLLARGAHAVATDLSEVGLNKLAKTLNRFEHRLETIVHDIRKPREWESVLQVAEQQGKGLYALVNCAAILKPGYLAEVSAKDIDNHIDINLKGTILGGSMAAKLLREKRQGHIINVASLAGVAAIPGIALYSASKFGVRGFSLALAHEMKEFGVKVTVVCPDAVSTPMLDLQVDYEEAALTFSGSRALSADEVAGVIIETFASDEIEVLYPTSRGLLAKVTGAAPGLSSVLIETLKGAGLKKQAELKS